MPLRREYLPATGVAQQELVLLHGWGCNREVWRPLLVGLRPWADITLLDLPGCAPGLDEKRAPALPALLADVLDCSPRRAVYVGWSLGGQLAIELAMQAPERVSALVTICTNPSFVERDDWPGMGANVFCEFRARVQADPVAALHRFDTLQVTGSRQSRQLLRELQCHGRDAATTGLLAGLGWLETLDQRETLSALGQPQLHLLAQEDALVPAKLAQCIDSPIAVTSPGAVKVIRHASHLAPLDAPAELAREIHGFLAKEGMLCASPSVTPELEKKEVAASFSRAAPVYDTVARLQREVGAQLLDYLDGWQSAPARILDLGCGTGFFRPALSKRYPQAHYVGLDIATGMVKYASERCRDKNSWLVADAEALPLASESVDLVFSSLVVQWCYRPEQLFAEMARVLRPGGMCVFSSLGPDTLCELRAAWSAVDSHQHVNSFMDMSDLLAAAQRVPGVEVRLESRPMRMEYVRVRELLDELKTLGAHNMNRGRPVGLTSRRTLQGMLYAYERQRSAGFLPATYDVIYGVVEKS